MSEKPSCTSRLDQHKILFSLKVLKVEKEKKSEYIYDLEILKTNILRAFQGQCTNGPKVVMKLHLPPMINVISNNIS